MIDRMKRLLFVGALFVTALASSCAANAHDYRPRDAWHEECRVVYDRRLRDYVEVCEHREVSRVCVEFRETRWGDVRCVRYVGERRYDRRAEVYRDRSFCVGLNGRDGAFYGCW